MINDRNTDKPALTSPGDVRPTVNIAGPSPLAESHVDSDIIAQKAKSAQSAPPDRSGGAMRRKLHQQSMGPLKKILLFLALFFVLYSLAGFLLAPYLLTTTLPAFLAKKLNRPVTIGSAQVNPYTLHITLKNGIIGPDLAVADDKVDPVLSFGRIEGRINPTFFLHKNQLIKTIRANSVFVHLDRQNDGRLNTTTMFARLTTPETAFNLAHLAAFVQTGDLNLTDSRLIFTDQPSATQHTLEEISFSFSKRDKDSTALSPHFTAIINGSPISVGDQNESSVSGQNTHLTFTLEQINLAEYLAYLPHPFPGLITKGVADIEILLDYQLSPDNTSHFEITGSGVARDIWFNSPEQGENKIASANFSLRFDPLLSKLTIAKLILEQPDLQLQRRKDGTYVFPGAPQKKPALSGPTIDLETLIVKNGRLSYIDQKVQGGFGAIFNDITLSINRTSNEQSLHAYALNCVTSRDTRISSQGKVSLTKGNVDGLLILHNLLMPALNTYLPAENGITLSSGIIDKAEATLHLSLQGQQNNRFTLSKLKGSATNLDIFYQGKEWLHIDQGIFTDVTFASDSPQIFLGNMSISGLLGHFSPANTLFFTNLFSQEKNKWPESFATLTVKNGTLLLHDFSFQKKSEIPIKILGFDVSGFSNKVKTPGKIDATFALSEKGTCQFQGDLSLAPLAGTFQLTMQNIPMNIFAAKQLDWFTPQVKDGFLDFNGNFTLADLSFDGRASLANFRAQTKSTQNKIISLKKASSPHIHLDLKPFTLQMDTLDLDELELFATLSPDVDSLSSLFFSKEKSGEMTRGNMEIKKISLKNGSLHFSDNTLNPPFATTLSAIHGSITDLTSRSGKVNIDITGHNNDQATLKSIGSINLFGESFGADLSISLVKQPLAPFIPYLEPMVGHRLSGGIFDLSLSYKESDGKVNADTVLTLRHLILGENNLGNKQFPATVALVMNNDQIIRLAIPVVGGMTDPSYTFHSAYGKKLRNLISKASVSPFSMLTEFYDPKQPPPDHVLFKVGATEPTDESYPQLLAIKNILAARPHLTVTLKGYSSGSEDRDALLQKKKADDEKKRLALQNSLSSNLIVSYGKEEIVTPPAIAPSDSSAIFTISKEVLLVLARERCLQIKDILTDTYGVDEKRVLISPDTTVVPESGAGLAGNRVDFILGHTALSAK